MRLALSLYFSYVQSRYSCASAFCTYAEYTAYIKPHARTTTALSFLNRILRDRRGLGMRKGLALDFLST